MHWPGAGPLLVLGSLILMCPNLILYVVQQFKEKERKFSEYWKAVFLIIFVSILFIAYASNYSRDILTTYVQIEDAFIKTNTNIISFNNDILDELSK